VIVRAAAERVIASTARPGTTSPSWSGHQRAEGKDQRAWEWRPHLAHPARGPVSVRQNSRSSACLSIACSQLSSLMRWTASLEIGKSNCSSKAAERQEGSTSHSCGSAASVTCRGGSIVAAVFVNAEHLAAPAATADRLHRPFVELGDCPAMLLHRVTIAHRGHDPSPCWGAAQPRTAARAARRSSTT
jgi:hypothetical protein